MSLLFKVALCALSVSNALAQATGTCVDYPAMIAEFGITCAQAVTIPSGTSTLCLDNLYVMKLCPLTCGHCATFCDDSDLAMLQFNRNVGVDADTPQSMGTDTCVPLSVATTILQPAFGYAPPDPRAPGQQPLSESGFYVAFCPTSSGVCTLSTATARRDPHFRLPHGGRADIKGEDGAVFNLLSAKNVSFSAKFEAADFQWSKRTVHGTKMSAAFWTVRTQTGKMINVEFAPPAASGEPVTALVTVDKSTVHKLNGIPDVTIDNLKVSLSRRKMTVATERWSMSASANSFPFASLNKGKQLLDIEVTPLYDADKDVVAPHGIFGQAYDGDELAVDGATDVAQANEMSTKAQGEGAIEGAIADYKMAAPFDTAFKYSRFDATSAPHRDVLKLTGHKHAKVDTHPAAHHNEDEAISTEASVAAPPVPKYDLAVLATGAIKKKA